MTLNVNLTKRLRIESHGFCYKVALYLSYLHIKFDKIKGNPFEFQAYVPIRLFPRRLGLAFFCSQISQLMRIITQIYGNERTCDKYKYTNDGTQICRSAECLLTF